MAINYPGPYEVVFKILVLGMEHESRYNCIAIGDPPPGTPVASVSLQTRSNVPRLLQLCVDDLWTQMRPHFHTGVTHSGFELWRYPTAGSLARDFITAGAVTNPAGTSSGAVIQANEDTLSFRSANGGIMKFEMQESSFQTNQVSTLVPSATGSTIQRIAQFILSANGWLLARDDAFPFAAYRHTSGQNEAIYRRRYRNN